MCLCIEHKKKSNHHLYAKQYLLATRTAGTFSYENELAIVEVVIGTLSTVSHEKKLKL